MGRWINWTLSGDLSEDEVIRLRDMVDTSVRPALPPIVTGLQQSRRGRQGLALRLLSGWAAAAEVRWADDPDTIRWEGERVIVEGTAGLPPFVFGFRAGDGSGHSVGLQDYAVFALLASASEVSGKVTILGGDDVDYPYVQEILSAYDACCGYLIPHRWDFLSPLREKHDRERQGDCGPPPDNVTSP